MLHHGNCNYNNFWRGVLVTQGQPNWTTFFCLCYFYVFSNYDDMDISTWIFFYFASLTIRTGCFQHNIRSLMTHLQVCQKIFPLLSKDFFLFWVSCCAARTKKILIVFWKPALVAENINVSLRKQRETETFKENIHILIIVMLDFQSFNSGPDLIPLTKSIWKTLSGGNFI